MNRTDSTLADTVVVGTSDFDDDSSVPSACDGARTGATRKAGRSAGRGRARRRPAPWTGEDEGGNPIVLTDKQRQRFAERAMNSALWHLGQSAKTRKQIEDKLTAKGIPPEIVDQTLARLEELGYLDDEAYAQMLVRSRSVNQLHGPRAIQQALRMKGVDPDTAAAALEALDSDTEYENAKALVQRRLRATAGLDRRKRTQRLVAMLARKGYSGSIVYQVVREVLDADVVEDDITG